MVKQAVDMMQETDQGANALTVDTLGLILRVYVMAASVENVKGQTSSPTSSPDGKRSISAAYHLGRWFDGEPFMQWVITVCGWIVQVVCCDQNRPKGLC